MGHTLGKAMKNFKDSLSGVENASFRKLDEKLDEKLEGRKPEVTQQARQNHESTYTNNTGNIEGVFDSHSSSLLNENSVKNTEINT